MDELNISNVYNEDEFPFRYRLNSFLKHNDEKTDKQTIQETDRRATIVVKGTWQDENQKKKCLNAIHNSGIHVPYSIVEWKKVCFDELQNDLVVILYTNTIVQFGWFDALVHKYEEYCENCIVGSKIVDCAGNIISIGSFFDGRTYRRQGEGHFFGLSEYEYVQEMDALEENDDQLNLIPHYFLWKCPYSA